MNDDYDYGADVIPAGENILASISGLALDAHNAEKNVATVEEDLKQAKAAHRDLTCFRLPELMVQAGQKFLMTTNGLSCEMKDTVRASISEERKPAAFAWLNDNNAGGMIKMEVKLELGKGAQADERLARLIALLSEMRVEYEVKKTVHPQTLAAFVREGLAEGRTLPMEILGATVQREVSVKVPKK